VRHNKGYNREFNYGNSPMAIMNCNARSAANYKILRHIPKVEVVPTTKNIRKYKFPVRRVQIAQEVENAEDKAKLEDALNIQPAAISVNNSNREADKDEGDH